MHVFLVKYTKDSNRTACLGYLCAELVIWLDEVFRRMIQRLFCPLLSELVLEYVLASCYLTLYKNARSSDSTLDEVIYRMSQKKVSMFDLLYR